MKGLRKESLRDNMTNTAPPDELPIHEPDETEDITDLGEGM